MKKVKAICIYRDNKVYNFTALYKDTEIPLIRYSLGDSPYEYNTFDDLYKDMLSVLKSNDMYCGHIVAFERKWYNISFIDLNNPVEIERFSLKE